MNRIGVSMPISIDKVVHWRTHAKLAVQPQSKWGGLKIGLFKENSHDVISIPECQVQHPNINYAIEIIKSAAVEAGVKGYVAPNEKSLQSRGDLRYVQVTVERLTGKLQLTLVVNAFQYKECPAAIYRLVKQLKSPKWSHLWHSIHLNFHTTNNNVIFNFNAKGWINITGHKYLKERIGDYVFFMSPQAFRQANLDAFEQLIIPYIQKYVRENSSIVELYSGIGIVGLNMLRSNPQSVTCIDNNQFLPEAFKLSNRFNFPEESPALTNTAATRKVSFHSLTAEDAIDQGHCDGKTLMIADPPRKGLDKNVLRYLIDIHPNKYSHDLERLIYIGCGFDAVQRDTT